MKKRLIILSVSIVLFCVICSFAFQNTFLLKRDIILSAGDTSSFSPNTIGKWDIISSYLNQYTTDSVEFELILVQRAERISGGNEKFIGNITNPIYLPQKTQKITYNLLIDNVWEVKITRKGECYLRQVKGSGINKSELPGNPDVLPIRVLYGIK
jgi:hypothetical protein